MSFEDIDTPISEAELAGDEPAAVADEPAVAAEQIEATDPAKEPPAESAKEPAPEPAEAEAKDGEPDTPRSPVIPRGRFDEVNAKLHAEREENARLKAELEAAKKPAAPVEKPATVDVDALEQQYYDAMMEGEKAKALEIRKQINRELKAQAEASASENITRQITAREQQSALNSAAARAVESYPFLNSSAAEANHDAINEVVEWRDFYASKGEPIHVALEKAVAKVAPMYAKPAAEPAPAAAQAQDTRRQAAAVRNLREASQQPPAPVAGIGNRAAPAAPKVETQQDWEALPTAERERLLAES